jgi:hypothetical protein
MACWDLRMTKQELMTFERPGDTNQRLYFDLHADGQYLISGCTVSSCNNCHYFVNVSLVKLLRKNMLTFFDARYRTVILFLRIWPHPLHLYCPHFPYMAIVFQAYLYTHREVILLRRRGKEPLIDALMIPPIVR